VAFTARRPPHSLVRRLRHRQPDGSHRAMRSTSSTRPTVPTTAKAPNSAASSSRRRQRQFDPGGSHPGGRHDSPSKEELAKLDAHFLRILKDAAEHETVNRDTARKGNRHAQADGERPTGRPATEATIVRHRGAAFLSDAMGYTPSSGASSTDSISPISIGIPAVTSAPAGRRQGPLARRIMTWPARKAARHEAWASADLMAMAGKSRTMRRIALAIAAHPRTRLTGPPSSPPSRCASGCRISNSCATPLTASYSEPGVARQTRDGTSPPSTTAHSAWRRPDRGDARFAFERLIETFAMATEIGWPVREGLENGKGSGAAPPFARAGLLRRLVRRRRGDPPGRYRSVSAAWSRVRPA